MENEKIISNFNLLKNICQQNSNLKMDINVAKLQKMLMEEIPKTLEKNAPPNFPELYFNFKAEYEKFKDFILYDKLIGKNIVALGGGFSSGKSSFLNALMGKKILPANINPSTSVPAYLIHGEEEVYGINIFDTKIHLLLSEIQSISHGFGETFDENDEVVTTEATLGHLLESIFISTPNQGYENIAFLDTPGYSKPDTATYSIKTDEKIARTQLNGANYILWFIPADGGTITEEDIKFIQSLNKETPKLFILNKADKRSEQDLKEIIDKIKSVLDIKGIRHIDVLPYSRFKPTEYGAKEIKECINQWNKRVEKNNFAYNFKLLFTKCKNYYDQELQEESKRLFYLKKTLLFTEDEEVSQAINSLMKVIEKKQKELKLIQEKLKLLQDSFFKEIKRISDMVGIDMPEPSEIDLIRDTIVNPLEIFQKYNKKRGAKENLQVRDVIEDFLSKDFNGFSYQFGGAKYYSVILDVLNREMV